MLLYLYFLSYDIINDSDIIFNCTNFNNSKLPVKKSIFKNIRFFTRDMFPNDMAKQNFRHLALAIHD